MSKIELLAPAGDLEKLKIAVQYGADAVYFGGEAFSLRAGAGNFSVEDMREGIAYAHANECKCYLTLNIFAHNEDLAPLEDFLKDIKDLGIDAYLVSDPGVMDVLHRVIPSAEIHLSTQANMTNYATANFWYRMGVRRLVLARELSIAEIRQIRENIPKDMELEAFVHGAMCISYSGRCLLSNVMTGRDANRGACAHPCRYRYQIMEEKRPGEYFPIEEDARGTYIMNSNDLCMIRHIADLAEAGIQSFKIEGRMKSIFYIASVIGTYRRAIDAYLAGQPFQEKWMTELDKASHRKFTTGFYYGKPGAAEQNYESSAYMRGYTFTGLVLSYDPGSGYALVEQRNKMVLGDRVEVFGASYDYFDLTLEEILDAETGTPLQEAPHAQQKLKIKMPQEVYPGDMLRLKNI